jgi:hypothetical protein
MCISVALKYNPKYVKALVRRAKIADALEDYELAVRGWHIAQKRPSCFESKPPLLCPQT